MRLRIANEEIEVCMTATGLRTTARKVAQEEALKQLSRGSRANLSTKYFI
jgi:hypothetical protein